MLQKTLYAVWAVIMLAACSTDYSDNEVLAGVQTINDRVEVSASLLTYPYVLKEKSDWCVTAQGGDALDFEARSGAAGVPVVLNFGEEGTSASWFEVRMSTGTKVHVDVVRKAEMETVHMKMLQFNIWQEGTSVSGGYSAIVDEIARVDPDFVMLSEVRNYSNVDFTKKLANSLSSKGLTYYTSRSDDSGLLSKYPVQEFKAVYPLANDHGSVYKLVTEAYGIRFAVYTTHLDYTNYACYLPRGYDGATWGYVGAPVTDLQQIQNMNLASYRDEEIKAFIEDAETEFANGALVALGGDFNEPSHLDWAFDTKDLYDHNGVAYNWDQSMSLQQAGFVDAYRAVYPSAVTHPGFTYPSDNPAVAVSKLTWAPKADERERIDFIYFRPDIRWKLTGATLIGPSGTIAYGQRVPNESQDEIVDPLGTWPSDHKALLVEFDLLKN